MWFTVNWSDDLKFRPKFPTRVGNGRRGWKCSTFWILFVHRNIHILRTQANKIWLDVYFVYRTTDDEHEKQHKQYTVTVPAATQQKFLRMINEMKNKKISAERAKTSESRKYLKFVSLPIASVVLCEGQGCLHHARYTLYRMTRAVPAMWKYVLCVAAAASITGPSKFNDSHFCLHSWVFRFYSFFALFTFHRSCPTIAQNNNNTAAICLCIKYAIGVFGIYAYSNLGGIERAHRQQNGHGYGTGNIVRVRKKGYGRRSRCWCVCVCVCWQYD